MANYGHEHGCCCLVCRNSWMGDGPGITPVDVWQRNRHETWASHEARQITGPAPDEIHRNMMGQIVRVGQ